MQLVKRVMCIDDETRMRVPLAQTYSYRGLIARKSIRCLRSHSRPTSPHCRFALRVRTRVSGIRMFRVHETFYRRLQYFPLFGWRAFGSHPQLNFEEEWKIRTLKKENFLCIYQKPFYGSFFRYKRMIFIFLYITWSKFPRGSRGVERKGYYG